MPTRHSAALQTNSAGEKETSQFAAAVYRGLTSRPRCLEPIVFYDALGSALFDAICRLPWYPITRAEHRLLRENADSIAARFGDDSDLIELGPGNGEKLAYLTEALGRHGSKHQIHLVDISEAALATAAARIETTGFRAACYAADFLEGFDAALTASTARRRIACFLGSNIGNFSPEDAAGFLSGLRGRMHPDDGLFLGFDLVKDEAVLKRAYDDPLGVTAAFNKNALSRINFELGGHFDLDTFKHEAVWNAEHSRIEMYLVSRCPQRVRIDGLDLDLEFDEGATIWTESSHKYTLESIKKLLHEAGFEEESVWVDETDGFAEAFYLAV